MKENKISTLDTSEERNNCVNNAISILIEASIKTACFGILRNLFASAFSAEVPLVEYFGFFLGCVIYRIGENIYIKRKTKK